MNLWEYMEGYDRELDENEFDARLWEAIHEPGFSFGDEFTYFCMAYGFADAHEFLQTIRRKKTMGKIIIKEF